MVRKWIVSVVGLVGFFLGVLANSVFHLDRSAEGYPYVEEFPVNLDEEKVPSHVSLRGLSPVERKRKFTELLVPLIRIANGEVLKERKFILKVKGKKRLSEAEEKRLKFLLKKYRARSIGELLVKVNAVPVSLVLAQGAVESGWGTSRFFTEANNIFGIYSFKGGKCLKARESKACLKVYDNLLDSVRDYIYNLNVGWAYRKFRELRSKGADVYTLADSLNLYSTKREEYGEIVKKVIAFNNLQRFDSVEFASNDAGFRR